jgi:hypothetical protein
MSRKCSYFILSNDILFCGNVFGSVYVFVVALSMSL